MTRITENSWRNVIAALANPQTRKLYAMILLEMDPGEMLDSYSPSRRRHFVESLLRTGTISTEAKGHLNLLEDSFARILDQNPAHRRKGLERFFVGGKIDQYPSGLAEREELLQWIARQVLRAEEVLDERTLNERLSKYADDSATLRRYLVDFSIVERRRDGSEYCLTSS